MFFFNQKTAYELRISDWSSDVCSSDLAAPPLRKEGLGRADHRHPLLDHRLHPGPRRPRHPQAEIRSFAVPVPAPRIDLSFFAEIGRASCRERVCQYVSL